MFSLVLALIACAPTAKTNDTADTAEDTGSDTGTDTGETADTGTDTGSDTGTDTGDTTDTGSDTGDTTDTGSGGGGGGSAADLAVGDIVITEIMKNPHGLSVDSGSADSSDLTGEWFEVHNTTGATVNLRGLVLGDNDATDPDRHTIDADVLVAAGGYVVIGNATDDSLNGGVEVAYAWDTMEFSLGNGDDEIVLSAGGTMLDAVVYTQASFPDYKGYSMELALSGSDDHLLNDIGSNWCEATRAFGPVITYPGTGYRGVDRQYGTPGAANDPCATAAR